MNAPKNLRIAIIVFPFAAENTYSIARKIVRVVSEVTTQTVLISGGISDQIEWPDGVQLDNIGVSLHYVSRMKPAFLSVILWIFRFFLAQFRLGIGVFRRRHQIDVILCTLGVYYQFPIWVARLCRKKVIVANFGNDVLQAKLNYDNRILVALVRFLKRHSNALADAILVESQHVIKEEDLSSYQSKVYNGALYIENLAHFRRYSELQKSGRLVGFIGRLVVEKGIREFLQAIPLALEHKPDLQFLIIGTGGLDDEIVKVIQTQPWKSHVEWIKWVDHGNMPAYLNRLDLLVMPSFTEGLPNLAMEALACGTLLLASPVGGIPDLVVDGKTGFLLEDHSPQSIADAIVQALNNPNKDEIHQRARALIENKYSLKAALLRYRAIFSQQFSARIRQ